MNVNVDDACIGSPEHLFPAVLGISVSELTAHQFCPHLAMKLIGALSLWLMRTQSPGKLCGANVGAGSWCGSVRASVEDPRGRMCARGEVGLLPLYPSALICGSHHFCLPSSQHLLAVLGSCVRSSVKWQRDPKWCLSVVHHCLSLCCFPQLHFHCPLDYFMCSFYSSLCLVLGTWVKPMLAILLQNCFDLPNLQKFLPSIYCKGKITLLLEHRISFRYHVDKCSSSNYQLMGSFHYFYVLSVKMLW